MCPCQGSISIAHPLDLWLSDWLDWLTRKPQGSCLVVHAQNVNTALSPFKVYFIFSYVSPCVYAQVQVPLEGRTGHQVPWGWSYVTVGAPCGCPAL